jgi:3-oxoacyl-(acyl-carrier-protein) synthase
MANQPKIVVTGAGTLCAAGKQPAQIWDAICRGRSALSPIRQWDTTDWPRRVGGESSTSIRGAAQDRKIQKFIRSDVFGCTQRIRQSGSGITAHRDALDEAAAAEFSDAPAHMWARVAGPIKPIRLLPSADRSRR